MKGYHVVEGGKRPLVGDRALVDVVFSDGRKLHRHYACLIKWPSATWWRYSNPTTPEDIVNHPPHYKSHPSGVECIQITEHMNFCRGNAMKYLWRAGEKGNEIEDLKKARWYLDREIARLEKSDEH